MILNRVQICLILLCITAAARAQTPTPPPVKMGLWETSVTTQMGGMQQLPPDVVAQLQAMGRPVPGAPHTIVTQSCLTRDQWQKDMDKMNQPRSTDCEVTNRQTGAGKYSFDISCKSQHGGTMNGHWEIQYVDEEHTHGSGRMANDQAGPSGQSFSMQTTIDSHFLSSDCGDIQPGSPKIVKQ
jgi:Protein of unknown function (DUF3617)